MESVLKQPEPLQLETPNKAETWKKWKRRWELYSQAVALNEQDKSVRSSVLLMVIGEEADKLAQTFEFATGEDKTDDEVLLKKFEDHFKGKTNLTMERHKFNQRIQQPGESFDSFLTDLKAIAENCEFGALCDGLIKDRIVYGITNNAVRAQMLQKHDLQLAKAIEMF